MRQLKEEEVEFLKPYAKNISSSVNLGRIVQNMSLAKRERLLYFYEQLTGVKPLMKYSCLSCFVDLFVELDKWLKYDGSEDIKEAVKEESAVVEAPKRRRTVKVKQDGEQGKE